MAEKLNLSSDTIYDELVEGLLDVQYRVIDFYVLLQRAIFFYVRIVISYILSRYAKIYMYNVVQ